MTKQKRASQTFPAAVEPNVEQTHATLLHKNVIEHPQTWPHGRTCLYYVQTGQHNPQALALYIDFKLERATVRRARLTVAGALRDLVQVLQQVRLLALEEVCAVRVEVRPQRHVRVEGADVHLADLRQGDSTHIFGSAEH